MRKGTLNRTRGGLHGSVYSPLSKDPIEFLSGDYNFYRYVGNDPVNFRDPLGLAAAACPTQQTAPKSAKITLKTPSLTKLTNIPQAIFTMVKMGFEQIGLIEADVAAMGGAIPAQDVVVGPDYVCQRDRDKANTQTMEGTGAEIEGEGEEGSKCKNSSKNKGDCAEKLVNNEYKRQGYEPFDTKGLENGSGHGIDNVAVNPKTNEVAVVETKANTLPVSKKQRLGGDTYTNSQVADMRKGFENGKGRWKSFKGDEEFGELLDALEKILTDETKNKTFKICRVKLEDDPTGCYGKDGNGQCKGEVNCEKDW